MDTYKSYTLDSKVKTLLVKPSEKIKDEKKSMDNGLFLIWSNVTLKHEEKILLKFLFSPLVLRNNFFKKKLISTGTL